MYVIDFTPPMEGFDGRFNTFRLGLGWSKRLSVGDRVFLADKKRSWIFGQAEVEGVMTGKLGEMANLYAAENHNHKSKPIAQASENLIANMVRRYGPHICDREKKVTVIVLHMKRKFDADMR